MATFIGVGFLASASTSLIGGVASTAATVVGGAAQAGAQAGAQAIGEATRAYDVDTLFRAAPQSNTGGDAAANANQNAAQNNNGRPNGEADSRSEVTRILARGVSEGEVPAADRTYLTQLVSSRTGIPQARSGEARGPGDREGEGTRDEGEGRGRRGPQGGRQVLHLHPAYPC